MAECETCEPEDDDIDDDDLPLGQDAVAAKTEPAPEPGPMNVAESMFYILDTRQVVGNCALWWRPDGAGYTTQLEEAGLYSEEYKENKEAGSMRKTDIFVPYAIAQACACTHVRAGRLREALDIAGIECPLM